MKTVQRWQLITERLAAAGSKYSEHVFALHAGQHDIMLEAAAGALVSEIIESEVLI